MDVTPYLDLAPAPRVVFDRLSERGGRPRYLIAEGGGWRAVTWAEHARSIRSIATYLSMEGLTAGDRAVIFAPNRVEWMTAALAIQAAGGVMVPIYASSTAPQAGYVAEHSEARFAFVDTQPLLERVLESWSAYSNIRRFVTLDDRLSLDEALSAARARGHRVPTLADVEGRFVSWSRAAELGAGADREEPSRFDARLGDVRLEQTAIMLYTSGTTGNPKGVPLTHGNLATHLVEWLRALAPVLHEDGIDLFWLPMSHIFGYGEACTGNTLGFTSYLCPPQEVLPRLPEVRPTVLMSVPSYWEKLAALAARAPAGEQRALELQKVTGGRLRFCLSGGAGLKREVKELFHDAGTLIIEGYGLTETSPTLTINRPDAFRFDTVGRPLGGLELRLAGDGEILARGPTVFSGYFKDPSATRDAFTPDGWFKTGDVGRFTEDGFLQIVDRKKDILVTAGGKNVPPANIELRFKDDPLLANVVVYGEGKHYLVAGVWLNGAAVEEALAAAGQGAADRKQAIDALVSARIERVNAELASWERLKRFVVLDRPLTVEEGFLTPTLKVRRKKVYEAFRSELEGAYS